MTTITLALGLAATGQYCAPAQQFQSYSYQYQAPQVYAQPVVKEYQFVAVEPSYSAALAGDYIRRERSEAEARALIDELRELRLTIQRLEGGSATVEQASYASPQGQSYQPPAKASPQQFASPQGNYPDFPDRSPDYNPAPLPPPVKQPQAAYPSDDAHPGVAVLRNACLPCHGAEAPEAGLALFDPYGRLRPLDDHTRGRVLRAVASGAMPPDGMLSLNEIQAVIGWMNQ